MIIEIITIPDSKLKETGFGSNLACTNVTDSIKRLGHTAKTSICNSIQDLNSVAKRKPDLVILAAKYIPVENGDNIWLSEYFSRQDITFSGSNRKILNYDSDKVSAKSRLTNKGVDTAKYFTAIPHQFSDEDDLPLLFPLFLKPTDAANGNGIDDLSFVQNFSEFKSKVASLHALYRQPILVEEYLCGREFTVAVIISDKGKITASAIEIIPPKSSGGIRILGEEVKKSDTEVLKKIKKSEAHYIKSIAIKAFIALDARGFGRIDIKMDGNGKCYFMEANLIPGMKFGSSYFPQACKIANNLSYDKVISLILEECLSRATPKIAIPIT